MEFFTENLAAISLIALAIGVTVTIWKDTNLGILALGISFILGRMGGTPLRNLIGGFPTSLFLTLVGITFFFGIATTNGTLEKVTKYAIKSIRGNVALLPIVLFFVAAIVSSIGPGQISTAALMAPPVMALAASTGVSPLLLAAVTAMGAQGGSLSPLAPSGIIAEKFIREMGFDIPNLGLMLWFHLLLAFFLCAVITYIFLGGLKLIKMAKTKSVEYEALKNIHVEPFDTKQKITLIAIAVLIICIIFFKLDVGFMGFILGAILIFAKIGDEKKAIKAMPWSAIILVTGVTVLVKLMENVGGIELFARIIGAISTPGTVVLVVGFIAALISAYASTSGVIFPAFLPMAVTLVGVIGADPATALLPLAFTVCVAGSLTDIRPLSTTGAVFVASVPESIPQRPLFTKLLLWGLAQAPIGAVLCWILYTVLKIV
jgi:di/tricarboxylate transporter